MDTKQLYQQKYENYQKALNRQEAAYVPNGILDTGGLFWAGKTAFDVAGNHAEYAKALISYMDEMWVDVTTQDKVQ